MSTAEARDVFKKYDEGGTGQFAIYNFVEIMHELHLGISEVEIGQLKNDIKIISKEMENKGVMTGGFDKLMLNQVLMNH